MSIWYQDLCDYYNVDALTAIELGTRSKGRKPNLPGSITCQPVSGMTFEEIFDSKPRDTIEQKMRFYKDLGSWMCFRQSVYRKDFVIDHYIEHIDFGKQKLDILEYGCGIGVFVNKMIELTGGDVPANITFHLVDVAGEHLEFAKWRLKRKAPNANIKIYEIDHNSLLPTFENKMDFVTILDVLEHVPNPYDIIKNISEYCENDCVMFETWIDVKDPGYADLQESVNEREKTMDYIKDNYTLLTSSGDIRGWKKK